MNREALLRVIRDILQREIGWGNIKVSFDDRKRCICITWKHEDKYREYEINMYVDEELLFRNISTRAACVETIVSDLRSQLIEAEENGQLRTPFTCSDTAGKENRVVRSQDRTFR